MLYTFTINMWEKHKQQPGFTIVELLIVIVVIGILAAITIVSFNGVQNRANDTVVQSDLAAIAKQFSLYYVDKGTYPNSTSELIAAADPTAQPRVQIKPSKSAYDTSQINFIYCFGNATQYAIVAQSKSGTNYYVNNAQSAPQVIANFPRTQASICPAVGSGGTGQWGFNGSWGAWTL